MGLPNEVFGKQGRFCMGGGCDPSALTPFGAKLHDLSGAGDASGGNEDAVMSSRFQQPRSLSYVHNTLHVRGYDIVRVLPYSRLQSDFSST